MTIYMQASCRRTAGRLFFLLFDFLGIVFLFNMKQNVNKIHQVSGITQFLLVSIKVTLSSGNLRLWEKKILYERVYVSHNLRLDV